MGAFDNLYIEKFLHLLRLVLWKTGLSLDKWESEGVVQQTFFLVFQKAATYHGKTDAEAWSWIWTIACNHMIDVIRQKKVFEKRLVDLEDETCASQVVSFDDLAMDKKSWLNKFVSSLSPREQQLLILLQDDIPQKEIAVQLGVCFPRITQLKQSIRKKALQFEQ